LIGIAEPDVEKEDKGERDRESDPASGLSQLFFSCRVEFIANKDVRSNALSLFVFLGAATELQMMERELKARSGGE
jgi:hypothetical protein